MYEEEYNTIFVYILYSLNCAFWFVTINILVKPL